MHSHSIYRTRLCPLVAILTIFWGGCSDASIKRKCFSNEGLKSEHRVELAMTGSTLSGAYSIRDYDSQGIRITQFTGKRQDKSGMVWKITFKGHPPYELAPGAKEIVWRLVTRGKQQVLLVRTYGKNYNTNKYGPYTMEFSACGQGDLG